MTHVRGHKVKYSNRNNSAAGCLISLKFGTEFYHATGDTLQMFKVKGQRSSSQRKVTYQQWKSYKTAMNRLSDFKLGMGVVIKQDKEWCGVGRPAVAMHSKVPHFLVLYNLHSAQQHCFENINRIVSKKLRDRTFVAGKRQQLDI